MDQTYNQVLEETKNKLISLLPLGPKYNKESDKNGVLVHTQLNEENGLNINRIEFDADVSKAKLLEFLSDLRRRKEIEPEFEAKLVKQFDKKSIYYGKGKPPVMLVDPRDFVIINDQIDLPDGYTLSYGRSIELAEIPEVKGTQRAEMKFQGWFIKETGPNKCHGVGIVHIDPKGDIPKFALNKGHTRQAENILKSIEIVKKN